MSWVRAARGRTGAWLPLGLYTLLITVSPLVHHDLACHIKSPTHCDACQANPLCSRAEPRLDLPGGSVEGGGRVETPPARSTIAAPLPAVPGRSPPA